MTDRLKHAILAAALAAGLASPALADLGPKPTIDIAVSLPDKATTITAGVLQMCDDEACAKPRPLGRMGPQGFGCGHTGCGGRAYGFSRYARLDLTLSDGSALQSNIFKIEAFNARFTAAVDGDKLTVTAVP